MRERGWGEESMRQKADNDKDLRDREKVFL